MDVNKTKKARWLPSEPPWGSTFRSEASASCDAAVAIETRSLDVCAGSCRSSQTSYHLLRPMSRRRAGNFFISFSTSKFGFFISEMNSGRWSQLLGSCALGSYQPHHGSLKWGGELPAVSGGLVWTFNHQTTLRLHLRVFLQQLLPELQAIIVFLHRLAVTPAGRDVQPTCVYFWFCSATLWCLRLLEVFCFSKFKPRPPHLIGLIHPV